ncbi:DUF7255 family protein [Microbacterium sp. zg.Y909]|uniref:DUF7255 family protein n=1 Tax=Microbacterium sp. zg.Y909 TaxID=2969413 RepID=UPI00214C428B|nr:hypothetical protein [Microbacterium sp. zg.Y909]MCR2824433.1 hypothetical protein [Microbacterium sp. zg.Y909]
MAAYKHIGGVLDMPTLRPRGWDIPTTNGLIVELDEEQHFNRYRAATLNMGWAADLPWRNDYLAHCSEFERVALKSHSGGGFWTTDGAVAQFGPADPTRTLEQAGSPRWKQRAVYDAMRDAAAAAGSVTLARLSVHDRVGAARLGDALLGRAPLDLTALHALIISRTSGADRADRRSDVGRSEAQDGSVLPPTPTSGIGPGKQGAETYEPSELARMLGYHDESRPGLVVRTYLRKRYPNHPKNARWVLDKGQANDVLMNVPRKQ